MANIASKIDVVALRQIMQRLARNKLLRDLPFEFHTVNAMFYYELHFRKPGKPGQFVKPIRSPSIGENVLPTLFQKKWVSRFRKKTAVAWCCDPHMPLRTFEKDIGGLARN